MEGITFITDEVGQKQHIVISLAKHKNLLKKFFRKSGVTPEGNAPVSPRKLRVSENGMLSALHLEDEVSAIRAENAALTKALQHKIAEYEEKIQELDRFVDELEDKVEEYQKEQYEKEEEEIKSEVEEVAKPNEKIKIDEADKQKDKPIKSGKVQKIIAKAESLMGTEHKLGGLGPEGIDCSGLTTVAFKEASIALPRTSRMQAEVGKLVESKEKLKLGDLVFFASGKPGKLNHVGIVQNVDTPTNIKFIHTSSSQGVTVSSLSSGFWAKCYLKARRII